MAFAGLLYDWLYPAHFPALRASLQAWADEPEVTTIILKFLAEFVWNKTSRLAFDSCSANGILLFREVSQVSQQPHCLLYLLPFLSLPVSTSPLLHIDTTNKLDQMFNITTPTPSLSFGHLAGPAHGIDILICLAQ